MEVACGLSGALGVGAAEGAAHACLRAKHCNACAQCVRKWGAVHSRTLVHGSGPCSWLRLATRQFHVFQVRWCVRGMHTAA